MKQLFHAIVNLKKAGVAILTSDKIDFKPKTVTRKKDNHFIMIKGLILQEDRKIIFMHPTLENQNI